VPEYPYQITAFATKDVEVTRVAIAPERLLHLQRQTILALADIGRQSPARPGRQSEPGSTNQHVQHTI
jgi:hypothetical protein